MVELCGAQRARSAAGVVQRQLCCVRTGGSGAVAGQPTGVEPHLVCGDEGKRTGGACT